MTQVLRAALTDQPIFLAEHEELVSHRSAGAHCRVRRNDPRP